MKNRVIYIYAADDVQDAALIYFVKRISEKEHNLSGLPKKLQFFVSDSAILLFMRGITASLFYLPLLLPQLCD